MIIIFLSNGFHAYWNYTEKISMVPRLINDYTMLYTIYKTLLFSSIIQLDPEDFMRDNPEQSRDQRKFIFFNIFKKFK